MERSSTLGSKYLPVDFELSSQLLDPNIGQTIWLSPDLGVSGTPWHIGRCPCHRIHGITLNALIRRTVFRLREPLPSLDLPALSSGDAEWPLNAPTLPVPLVLLEQADTIPFTFSPVAPGYFLPSPGWTFPRILTYAPKPRMLMWSAAYLRSLSYRLGELLGPVASQIIASDTRGRASATPPKYRHLLARQFKEASVAYLYVENARPYIDPSLVAAMHTALSILERASREPTWPEIRASCTDNQAYAEALDLLERVNAVMGRLAPPGDFAHYVASLRKRHRRLRNFMALLGQAGW